jgi:hypothetical protein
MKRHGSAVWQGGIRDRKGAISTAVRAVDPFTSQAEGGPMPYLHLDLPGTYPVEVKRELATRLCKLYAEVMEGGRMSVSPSSASTTFITWVPTVLSPSPWSWSSFVVVARRKNGWP